MSASNSVSQPVMDTRSSESHSTVKVSPAQVDKASNRVPQSISEPRQLAEQSAKVSGPMAHPSRTACSQ